MKKILLAALAISILLTGCGKSPTETVTGYLDAGLKNDLGQIKSSSTSDTALIWDKFNGELEKEFKRFENYNVVKEEIKDSAAVVTIKLSNGREEKINLAKVDGQWKFDFAVDYPVALFLNVSSMVGGGYSFSPTLRELFLEDNFNDGSYCETASVINNRLSASLIFVNQGVKSGRLWVVFVNNDDSKTSSIAYMSFTNFIQGRTQEIAPRGTENRDYALAAFFMRMTSYMYDKNKLTTSRQQKQQK